VCKLFSELFLKTFSDYLFLDVISSRVRVRALTITLRMAADVDKAQVQAEQGSAGGAKSGRSPHARTTIKQSPNMTWS